MVERSDFKMNKRGITLLALVITIVIMLLLAAVVIGMTVNENGIVKKAEKANHDQAVAEMYEKLNENLSYMGIKGRITNDKEINAEKVYQSKAFKDLYEIRGQHIYDKLRKKELVKKQDFEKYVNDKLSSDNNNEEFNLTEKPSVIAVTNEDTAIKGTGKIGSDIIVKIGTNTYTGKVGTNGEFSISIPKQTSGTTITIVQKEEGKKESEEISLEVYKTRLEKIEIDKVVNTDTKVTGKAKPGADVKLVISRKRIYRKSK